RFHPLALPAFLMSLRTLARRVVLRPSLSPWRADPTAFLLRPPPGVPASTALRSAYAAQVARPAAETDRRVKAIEQRQLALAAALQSDDVDPATLRRLGFSPARPGDRKGGPFESVGHASCKASFYSFKQPVHLTYAE